MGKADGGRGLVPAKTSTRQRPAGSAERKDAAMAPRLYLVAPRIEASVLSTLAHERVGAHVACLLIKADPNLAETTAAQLIGDVQAMGVALLIEEDANLARRLNADGAHIRGTKNLSAALDVLKPERMVGVGGLTSRDEAMRAGEAGAHYVLFGDFGPRPTRPSLARDARTRSLVGRDLHGALCRLCCKLRRSRRSG